MTSEKKRFFLVTTIIASVIAGLIIFLLPENQAPGETHTLPDREQIRRQLAKEGRMVTDEELDRILWEKQIPIPEKPPLEASALPNNLKKQIFEIFQVANDGKIQVEKTAIPLILQKIVVNDTILEFYVNEGFDEIAKDELRLMNFTSRFMNIKNNPATGLKIFINGMVLSEYLKKKGDRS